METVITIPASLPTGGKLVLEILDTKAYVSVTDRSPSFEAGITLVWTLPTVGWRDAICRAIPHLIEYVRVFNNERSLAHDVVSLELGKGL